MNSGPLTKGGYIEGVGDEVVVGVVALLGLLIPTMAYILTRHRGQATIHPDSAANVEATRRRLQQNASNTSTNSTSSGSSNNRHPQPRRSYDTQVTCPICLGEATFAVDTNCGHQYCGNCIITYWHHQNWLGAVPCPSCRTQVTLLLPNLTELEVADRSEEALRIQHDLNDYNRRFSGEPRPFIDYLRDLPTLLRHAWNEFFTVGGLIMMFRIRIVVCVIAAFIYFISPLDIIPEAAFGILGFLDDVFIFLLLAIYISIIYRQFVEARAARAGQNIPPQPAAT